jgi:hypothetical protein
MSRLALLLAAALLASSVAAYSTTTMLCLVNEERARRGLRPLGIDSRLDIAAQQHADWQARNNVMSHTGASGSDPGTRVEWAGYEWTSVAENLAYGYDDEQATFDQWMNSPGHKANILGRSYTHMGSAVSYTHDGVPYYSQEFASDGGEYDFPMCPGKDDGDRYFGVQEDGHGGSSDPRHGGRRSSAGGGARRRKYFDADNSRGCHDNVLYYYDDDRHDWAPYNERDVVYYDQHRRAYDNTGALDWFEWRKKY